MSFPIEILKADQFPPLLKETPEPPDSLNYRGSLPPPQLKLLAVVGSRHYSNYGRQAVEYLVDSLKDYQVGIVSGLALGIDSLAHEAALKNNLYTLAIPGGGLDDQSIYPARHKPLARKILEHGGGLLSEYAPNFKATPWSFPQRNRLVCGIAHGTLVIEAGERSGSLITARLTVDYNRELLVVPGSIFSAGSAGTHQFLKLGATPVTCGEDIVNALGLEVKESAKPTASPTLDPEAHKLLVLLSEPKDRDTLIRELGLPTDSAAVLIMRLEIAGLIKEVGGTYFKL